MNTATSLANAADQALAVFTASAPPSFWEVLIPPEEGACANSYSLERAILDVAGKRVPPLVFSSLAVELKGCDAIKGAAFVVRASRR